MNVLTAYGPLDRSLIIRDRVTLDNAHEKTLGLEYRLKNPLRLPDGRIVLPDEVVKRSAHVNLKEWPDGMVLSPADLFRKLAERPVGLRPSDVPPGVAAKSLFRHLGHLFRFANSQAMCTSFKVEVLNGSHAFGTQAANGTRTVTTKDTFKIALYKATASLDATVTAYNVGAAANTNELAGTGNYTQGGNSVTNATAPNSSGTTSFWTPSASVSWAALTSSAAFDCALLYNTASTGALAVAVFTFSSQSITAGTFTLTMPTNDATTGLIRIA